MVRRLEGRSGVRFGLLLELYDGLAVTRLLCQVVVGECISLSLRFLLGVTYWSWCFNVGACYQNIPVWLIEVATINHMKEISVSLQVKLLLIKGELEYV